MTSEGGFCFVMASSKDEVKRFLAAALWAKVAAKALVRGRVKAGKLIK